MVLSILLPQKACVLAVSDVIRESQSAVIN